MKNDNFAKTRISSLCKNVFDTAKHSTAMSKEQAIFCLKLFGYNLFLVKDLAFIHLSTDRHLGFFHILATINSAAMNTRI